MNWKPLCLLTVAGCVAPFPVEGLDESVERLDGVLETDLYCVITSSGRAGCFQHVGYERNRYVEFPLASDARVVDLALTWYRACMVQEDGQALCWPVVEMPPLEFETPEIVGDDIVQLDISPGGQCMIDREGRGRCDGGPEADDVVGIAASTSCLLQADGDVVCREGIVPSALTGGLTALDSNAECGVRASGDIVCWDWWADGVPTLVPDQRGTPPPCEVTEDGRVACWGGRRTRVPQIDEAESDEGELAVYDLGAPVRSFVITRYATCALFEDGSVRCWAWDMSVGGLG